MKTSTFINELKTYRHLLPKQTIKTLRGQAIAGDIAGAIKGLGTALKKSNVMTMAHRQAQVTQKLYDVDYDAQLKLSLIESHRARNRYV